MNNLQYAHKVLSELQLIETWDELSSRWLGMCNSYARNLRSRGEDLPATALINLISRLNHMAEGLPDKNTTKILKEDLTHLRDHLSSELYAKSLSPKSMT